MNNEQMIGDVYRVLGMLEGVVMMRDSTVSTTGMFAVIDECIDRLQCVGTDLLAKDVQSDDENTRRFGFESIRERIADEVFD